MPERGNAMKATEMRRWTRIEYDRMIAAGTFTPGESLELIDGEILQMPFQGSYCSCRRFFIGDILAPLAAPEAKVSVRDLLGRD